MKWRLLKIRFLLGVKNKNDPYRVSEGLTDWWSFPVTVFLGTVDNHGNTEIMVSVISVFPWLSTVLKNTVTNCNGKKHGILAKSLHSRHLTKITVSVIFVKCRDFAKMPCFCQNTVVSRFHKNILFLISIIWSLLCEFNTKIFTFPLPLLPKSVHFVNYWQNMWLWHHRSMYFT